jgi:hypothetical protein
VYPQVRDFIKQFSEGPTLPASGKRSSAAAKPAAVKQQGRQRTTA